MSYDYDEQIERLKSSPPEEIREEWADSEGLFQYATRSGNEEAFGGCLTQIRRDSYRCVPGRPDLTEAIRADERIPRDSFDIRVEHLPVFREWQERLDRELRDVT